MGHLSLRNVRKTFGPTAVIQGIDLDVTDGEFLVLVGPSGCGKSTLLRMIAGLETIDSGELLIDGQPANEKRPGDRGAAMVFQSYALYPHMTVADNMGFALKMAGKGRAARDEQVQRAAQALQITELLGRFPRELSGGQRQRVAIGRAIVRQPKVFLFDEPLSNLDAALRVNMRIELRRLHRELGSTMIYVTHDQVEAMTLGDRIAVLNQGRVEQLGAPLTLYQRPATLFVATFLGAPRINVVDRPTATSTASHQQLWSAMGGGRRHDSQRMGLRAEHMGIARHGGGVPAHLVHCEHLGDACLLHLRVDGLADLIHAKLEINVLMPTVGQSVTLVPDALWGLPFDISGQLQS